MTSPHLRLDRDFAALKRRDGREARRRLRSTARSTRRSHARARATDGARAVRRFDAWLAWPLALAASIALLSLVMRSVPPEALADRPRARTPRQDRPATASFMPVVPLADIERAGDALVVPARMSRMTLAQLGLPVNPARAADAIDTELLVRRDGAVLALRFVTDARPKKAAMTGVSAASPCRPRSPGRAGRGPASDPPPPPGPPPRPRRPPCVTTSTPSSARPRRRAKSPGPRASRRVSSPRQRASTPAPPPRWRASTRRRTSTRCCRALAGLRRRRVRRHARDRQERALLRRGDQRVDPGAPGRQSHREAAHHAPRARHASAAPARSARANMARRSTSSIRSTAAARAQQRAQGRRAHPARPRAARPALARCRRAAASARPAASADPPARAPRATPARRARRLHRRGPRPRRLLHDGSRSGPDASSSARAAAATRTCASRSSGSAATRPQGSRRSRRCRR